MVVHAACVSAPVPCVDGAPGLVENAWGPTPAGQEVEEVAAFCCHSQNCMMSEVVGILESSPLCFTHKKTEVICARESGETS